MPPSWLRGLLKLTNAIGKQRRPGRKLHARPRTACRPAFEQFEERIVPTHLSIPTSLAGARNNAVSVPIDVDSLNDNSTSQGQMGLSGGEFVLFYDPAVLSFQSVQLGSIATVTSADPSGTAAGDGYAPSQTNGWQAQVAASNPATGYLAIELLNSSSGGLITGTGGGSLVSLNFAVLANAPLGASKIDLAADASGPLTTPNTFIADEVDNAGGRLSYTLQPNPNSQSGAGPEDNTGDVQRITFGGTINSGSTFTLNFNGNTTGQITYTANAANLQSAIQTSLNNLGNIGAGNTLVTAVNADTVTVTFQGTLGGGVTRSLMGWSSSLTGTNASISVADSGIGYYGLSSNDPAYVDPGDGTVTIMGTNPPPTAQKDAYQITEQDLASDPALSVAGPGVLANDNDPLGNQLAPVLVTSPANGTVVLNGEPTITFGGAVAGGAFQLDFDNFITNPIPYSSTPANLQANIQAALSNLPVTGFGAMQVNADSATDVTVTFQGATDLTEPALTVYGASLTGQTPTVSVNSLGSFVYTPNTGYLGPDSFTYKDTDTETGLTSNAATVNIAVTSRLSIPTNLTAQQGATVTVPVTIDNPNPSGSGGLNGVQLAIDFDSSALQVDTAVGANGVLNGTITGSTDEVQTITLSGTITGGSFALLMGTTPATVTYSSNQGVLLANIQTALNSLFGTTSSIPNATAAPVNATTFSVNFQNADAGKFVPTMSAANNLAGTNPAVTVATTTTGYASWPINASVNNTTQPGQLVINESIPNGQVSTLGGTIALIVFTVNGNALAGPTNIDIIPQATPLSAAVNTQLTFTNTTLTPRPSAQGYPTFVGGMDGIVTLSAQPDHFVISAPNTVTAGAGFSFTIFAENSSNNIDTSYNGTVSFTSSDSQVAANSGLPGNSALTSGLGTFTAILKTVGDQTLSATDVNLATLTGSSGTFVVFPGTVDHFAISALTTVTAGVGFDFTVTAFDSFNNTATTYNGNVTFSSSDSSAAFSPVSNGLQSGTGVFSAVLQTAGSQTLIVTDTTTNSIAGTSGPISVSPAAADHFALSAPVNSSAGVGFDFTVAAEDPFNNIATAYTGSVTFTTSDHHAVLPGASFLNKGLGTFSATLQTLGTQNLAAADSVNTTITAGASAVTVKPGPATHFVVSAASSDTAGVGLSFTVKAEDQFNNTASGYRGTVTFTCSDSAAGFGPTSSALAGGVGVFGVTLKTAGTQTLTAADTVNTTLVGISNAIAVNATAADHFVLSEPAKATAGAGFSFTVTAEDPFNNFAGGYSGTLAFTSSDSAAGFAPALTTLTGGVGVFTANLKTAGNQVFTVIDTVNNALTGTGGPILVSAAAVSHFAVTAPNNVTAGVGFNVTVTAEDAFGNTVAGYAGPVAFQAQQTFATGPAPFSVAVGDFNGDGMPDLVIANDGNSSVSVLLGNGNGTFQSQQAFATGADPRSVALGDVNGDGKPDIVVANYNSSTVSVLLGNGNGTFQAQQTFATGLNPFSVAVGDLTGDSMLDIIVANFTVSSVSVWLGNGNGTFQAQQTFATGANPISVAVADLNGDGKPDLIVSNDGSSTVSVLLGNGNGTFQAQEIFATRANPISMAVGDLNGDGKPDLVIANYNGYSVSVLIGNGNGTFQTQQTFGTGNDPSAVALGDISGDGKLDIVVADNTNSGVSLLLGNGDGTFQTQETFGVGPFPRSVALGDFNGDGKMDAVVANDGTSTVSVLLDNLDPGYHGAVALNSSDNKAVFAPGTAALMAGVGVFTATAYTAGSQTITATDTTHSTLTGTSALVTVSPAAASRLLLGAPSTATAGASFSITITAEDAYNNTAVGYAGTLTFTSSDSAAGFNPGAGILTSGIGFFTATLKTAGTQAFTVTDAVNTTLTVTSNPIAVDAAAANHFAVSAPSTVSAGTPFKFTVTAEDRFNNTAAGYTGIVTFTSSDSTGGFAPVLAGLTSGVGTFNALLESAGSQTLIATDTLNTTFTGTSSTVTVTAAAANHFVISAPSSATAGVSFQFTVTAEDPFNNTAAGYTGAVTLTSSDSAAILSPATGQLTSGIGTFSAQLATAGSQTLTATDTVYSTLSAFSGPIAVSAAAASHFVVNAPSTAGAGVGFRFTITAEDPFNNIAVGYAGIVTFSSSDTSAIFTPVTGALTAGVSTFDTTLNKAAIQTLTVTDTVNTTLTGVTSAITVSAAPANHFVVSAPSAVSAGVAFKFTITAEDPFNNIAAGYTGTTTFNSSDSTAAFAPVSGSLTGGVGTFNALLETAGNQTVTAGDTVNTTLTGTSSSVTVSAAAASHFIVSVPGTATAGVSFRFTVTAEDPFNNTAVSYTGSVTFSSSDHAAVFAPITGTLTSGVGTFAGTLNTAGNQTLTAADTLNATLTEISSSVTVSAATANHFVVSVPGTATAGAPFNFTVTAEDPFNNTATAYTGAVTLTGSDSAAVLSPVTGPLTGGIGTFSAQLGTAGSQTLTVADTVNATISAISGPVMVSAAAASHFVVSAPGTATAGVGFRFTVTAEDPFNNTAVGYTGTVTVTSSDTSGVFAPVTAALTAGIGTFAGTLNTAGNQTLTATSTLNASLTGVSSPVTVSAATTSHFVVSAPGTATAGVPFHFTVTAEDLFNNTATGYAGTVTFSSSDSASAFAPVLAGLTSGVGTFNALLATAGNQTLIAMDTVKSTLIGSSGPVTVSAATASHFVVSAPSTATAGVGINFTVTAEDSFNNTATGYVGTVVFTSGDSAAIFTPLTRTLTSGVGTFGVTFKAAYSQVVTATDAVNSTLDGSSLPVAVSAAAASHFVVTAPSTAVAGVGFKFTVVAEDPFNNTAASYAGSVTFTSTDYSTVFTPVTTSLTGGLGTFYAKLETAGNQTLTAADTLNTTLVGSSSPVTVSPAPAGHFVVSAPSAATAGIVFSVTIIAEDQFNNTAAGYGGAVTFTSSDASAVFAPATLGLVGGVGTFSALLKTAGNQVLTATDTVNATLTVSSNPVAVSPAAANHFVVGAPSGTSAGIGFHFTVTAEDPFNNTATGYAGTVAFTSSDTAAILSPTTGVLPGGLGIFSATLKSAGSQTLTVTDTVNSTLSGISNSVVVTTPTANHFVVSAPSTATAGVGFRFTVTAEDQSNNTATSYVGTVAFTSGDSAAVFLPATGGFTGGVGVFSATLETAGNQILSATDASVSSITGSSGLLAVSASAASHFVVSTSGTATAGVGFGVTVKAEDQFNNTVTGYSGVVALASTDSKAAFAPTTLALPSGMGTFNVLLKTAGNQTLTAMDTVNATLTGTSNAVVVSAAAASHFVVGAPTKATAGVLFSVTITAEDPFNNTATGYSGAASLSSTDSTAAFAPTTLALTGGVGTFGALLKGAGNQTLTAADTVDSTLTGTNGPIAVSAAVATHFAVSAPNTATAGSGFNFTVTAQDQFNNTVTTYADFVVFSSSDSAGVVPAISGLNNGQGTFSATLRTAGNQFLSAADASVGSITGASGPLAVSAAAVNHFVVSAPGATTAGLSFSFTVTAEDSLGNTVTGYTGTVAFSSTDSAAVFTPFSSALTSGVGVFTATLKIAGSQTISAADTVIATVVGHGSPIAVSAAAANHFVVAAPGNATAGTGFDFRVIAEDSLNNTATGYSGTVTFTSTDSAAVFSPTADVLTNGVGAFTATLKTAGNQTITAADTVNPTIVGFSGPVAVSPAAASHFVVNGPSSAVVGTGFDFTLTAEDSLGNIAAGYSGTVTLVSSDSAAVFSPALSTLTAGVGIFSVALNTPGSQTITAADATALSITGASGAVTVTLAPAVHFSVSGPSAVVAGTPVDYTISALNAANSFVAGYAGTVTFSSSDSAAAIVPPTAQIASGAGVFIVTLNTPGTQALTATDIATSSITGSKNGIEVRGAPDVPTGQVFSVTQGSPVGTVVGTVAASSPNSFLSPAPVLSYSTTSTVFAVDASTGQITVADPDAIDFATTPFSVPIAVADDGSPPLSTNATVTVDVVFVPPTVAIKGAPASSPEGTQINLTGQVTDVGTETYSYQWSVTRNGVAFMSGFDTGTNGPTFSFTPVNDGDYVVSLSITDLRGDTANNAAFIQVTNVAPVINVGSEETVIATGGTFTRSISFTAPGANNWAVSVDYSDGTTESLPLLPANLDFDTATKTFTLQHSYAAETTFVVTITVTDSEGGSGTAAFPVAVFDAAELALLIAYKSSLAGSNGTDVDELSAGNGTVFFNANLTNGVRKDLISLGYYKGDPEPITVPGASGLFGQILSPTGDDTPLEFFDLRAEAANQAMLQGVFEFILPSSEVQSAVDLLWFDKALGKWEKVAGNAPGDGFVIEPVLNSQGLPTGKSLLIFTETFGTGSAPTIAQLSGTVFSVAIPVGNGGSSSTIVLTGQLASSGSATGITVQTTGFGSGSDFTVSLQESSTSLALTGLVGLRLPADGPGEREPGSGSSDGYDQLLDWLLNGELWRDRRPSDSGQDGQPQAPPNDSRPAGPAPGNPGTVPPEIDNGALDALFASGEDISILPEPSSNLMSGQEAADHSDGLALAAVMAGALAWQPQRTSRLDDEDAEHDGGAVA